MEQELKNKLLAFRESIQNFTLEELEEKQKEIQNQISKMILDSDLILQAAVVDALISEKKGMQA